MSMREKNQHAASVWKALTQDKKDRYLEASKQLKTPELSQLSEVQKEKLIQVHKKNVINELLFLEDLGCESCVMFKDHEGQVLNFGSASGCDFLGSNPEINLKFRQYFSCTSSKKFTPKHVQELFNTKYSEAIKKPGSRVPYMHGGFEVLNLPEGITFKKPYNYGTNQLRSIMENKDKIKFIICDKDVPVAESREMISPAIHFRAQEDPLIESLFSKIVGQEAAARVLRNSQSINEEEIEVINLVLTQPERMKLYCCQSFFDDDSWAAVGHNLQHSNEPQGIIVPVYTDAEDERFWLFYLPHCKPSALMKIGLSSKKKGYWLDLEDNQSYKLLHENQDTLQANWIIHNEHGPIYYTHNMPISESQYFQMPDIFRFCILAVLQKNASLMIYAN